MPTLAPERPETAEIVRRRTIRPGYRGFVAFCEAIGEPLAAYQRRIARRFFENLELVVILPKGNLKTHTAALLGLHHLLVTPDAEVRIVAASRRHAEIVLKRMKGFARHPLVRGRVTITYFELRHEELRGDLTVVSSDGEKLHGDSPTLIIADEVWAWKNQAAMLEAVRETQMKRPGCRTIYISTAAARLDSPLGRLRDEAMAAPEVKRRGPVLEAQGGDIHWLEWSLPEDADLDDIAKVKQANPAPYISRDSLRRQRRRLPDAAFGQMHCNRWGVGEGQWLPAGAWGECATRCVFEDGEPLWLGIDIGGMRSASVCVAATKDLRVRAWFWQGEDGERQVAEHVRDLARRHPIREVAYDPWHFHGEALRLEERGLRLFQFAQSASRMVPASEKLYAAIVEKRLTHPNDPTLNEHVARAVAKETPRGWRLDKANEGDQVDGVIALAMVVDRVEASNRQKPARLIGWL